MTFQFTENMKRYLPFIFFFLLVSFILCFYKSIYKTKYDPVYSRDLYDHSQWMMPLAVRSIGDNLLHKVAGFDLIKTGKYFEINPEVPPLGKLLYGFSTILFKNGELISALLFIISIILFYNILKTIFKNRKTIYIGTFLFIIEPIVFSQASYTMLDLPQLIALLLHILSMLKIFDSKKKNCTFIFIAGLSLGAFISIKIGFFAAVILLADFILLWKNRKIKLLPIILILSIIIYCLTYFPYFLNHSLLDFAKAQKWMLTFYLSSTAKPVWGMVMISTLTGFYRGWSKNAGWDRFPEWGIFWIIYFFSFILFIFKKKEKDEKLKYIFYLAFGMFFLNLFITFWVRYLLLIIPLLIILFLKILLPKFNKKTFILLFVFFILQALFFLRQTPKYTIAGVKETWEKGIYQELYGYLDQKSQKSMSRYDFWRSMQEVDRKLGYPKRLITIKTGFIPPFSSEVMADFSIIYRTEIGNIKNTKKIIFKRDGINWKISWDKELILTGLSTDKISSTFNNKIYGKIKLKDGTVLSEGGIYPEIFVQVNKIKDENKLQKQIFDLTKLKKFEQEVLYRANSQVDWLNRMAFWPDEVDISKYNLNQLDPGIIIKDGYKRVYNRNYINKGKLQTIKDIENKYYYLLNPKVGGEIKIINNSGSVINLISKKPIKGTDIILDEREEKYFNSSL